MRKAIFSAAAGLLWALPLGAWASTWEADPVHSSAEFSVRHMMVANVRGTFDKMASTVELDDKDPTKSSVEATIDATTINTANEKRDAHLKSADFFDVEKYPTITFKSKKVAKAGANKYKVTGDLTMHGVTKEVVLDVELAKGEIKDPQGMTRRGASAKTKLNRKDFGLNWSKAIEGGGVVVGDEIAITIETSLIKKS